MIFKILDFNKDVLLFSHHLCDEKQRARKDLHFNFRVISVVKIIAAESQPKNDKNVATESTRKWCRDSRKIHRKKRKGRKRNNEQEE